MLKVLEGHTDGVWSVSFSSDDKHIVSGSWDKSVRVWDALTGEMLKVLEGHTGRVSSVSPSNDDKRIVSGSLDTSVRVWDASTGKMLKVLEGHTEPVFSVSFSSDDKRIVSGSWDKSVRVWDASTGEMLKVLEGHTEHVLSVPFPSDDKHIVSGSSDKSVQVWALPSEPTFHPYVRQKIADSSGYQRHTGWLLSSQGEHYLMFVPLGANLPDSSNILTLPRSYAPSLDFTSSCLGPEWHNCFSR
jgi:WD40 repeat protein